MKEFQKDGNNNFVCEECHKNFDKLKSLKSHIIRKHGPTINDYLVKWILDDKEKEFVCKECNHICKNKVSLSFHINHHHNIKEYYDKYMKKENEGICVICGNRALFKNIREGYQIFCSKKCRYIYVGKNISKTKLEKFKDLEYLKNFIIKIKKTKKEIYGDENYVNTEKTLRTFEENKKKDPDYQNKINEKHRQTCEKIYGNPSFVNKEQIRKTKNDKIKNDPNYIKNIIKKEEETCEKLYGDKNYRNIEQNKQTKKEKYRDENYNNNTKSKITKKEKYGNENYNNMEKNKQTKLERYNDENYNNREKCIETCLMKYNVKYFSQVPEIYEKQQKEGFKAKHYLNTNLIYRGSYEFDFLENYYERFKDEIVNSPTIRYIYEIDKKEHVYFPDFYIPSLNLIIEVKASYYYKRYKIKCDNKAKATKKAGFNYIMIINKDYSEFNKLISNL